MAQRAARDTVLNAGPAVGEVAVVRGSSPDIETMKHVLEERIPELSRLGLDRHLFRVALPRPGGDAELFRAVSHAMECPIDPDRPPWECWLIEGLRDNRWAILMKVHHRMADALPTARLLTAICDGTGHISMTNPVAGKSVSSADSQEPGWAGTLRQAGAVAGSITHALTGVLRPDTWMSPAGPVNTMRRYDTVRLPVAAVDGVCGKLGATANDVALAAITEGFRTVLLHRGEQPHAHSLPTTGVTDLPVPPYLPVHQSDPVRQLRTVQDQINRQADERRSGGISTLLPLTLCTKAIEQLTRPPRPDSVTLATDAPGPRRRLRMLKQPVERLLPVAPCTQRRGTGIAVLRYGTELVIGITADYDAASQLEQLAAGIELGMARLAALSEDSVVLFARDRPRNARPARTGRPPAATHRRRHPAPIARARR